jgi:hypothetical protein
MPCAESWCRKPGTNPVVVSSILCAAPVIVPLADERLAPRKTGRALRLQRYNSNAAAAWSLINHESSDAERLRTSSHAR